MRRGAITGLLLTLMLAGCGGTTLGPEHYQAKSRWSELGYSDYAYNFQRACECEPDSTREVRIAVQDGQIIDINYTDDSTPVPADQWSWYPTVDELFKTIEEAADENAAQIDVEYDPDAGYPTHIFIDYDVRIADEETIWQAHDLQPLITS